MDKQKQIISTAAEFITFKQGTGTDDHSVDVRFENGDLWLTQKMMGVLFNVDRSVITKHLRNIYEAGEINESTTCAKFAQVQTEGNRQIKRLTSYYNLDAVISVGYRVNSDRAIQFRRWATQVLKQYSLHGYAINKRRMINGETISQTDLNNMLADIREIRLSERNFYQKLTDIYATSTDYDPNSPISKKFFARVQNKMHYAVTRQTAAEIIFNRADADKDHMGLTNWRNAPDGKIASTDVKIAKNYLTKNELSQLELIVSAFLDLAEARVKRGIPMVMEDWATRIDKFILSDDRDLLKDAGKISRAIAEDKALTEFEKFRIRQDKLYKSDFDKLVESSEKMQELN